MTPLNPTFLLTDAVPSALRAALQALGDESLNGLEKGLPPVRLRLREVGRQGWNVLRGDVPLPALVLRWPDVAHNIRIMQAYCDQHGAWLAPHGKTTMAPQVYAAQLAAGAWAITVANVAQLQVCRAFGIDRVLIANEMVAGYDARYLAQQLREAPNFEPYVLVDSLAGVERLCRGLREAGAPRPVGVLVELGMAGGRTGVRRLDELEALAEAVLGAAPALRLAGVEGYEGIVPGASQAEQRAAAGRFLRTLAEVVRALRPRAPADQVFLVTAGGSIYFDQVVAELGHASLPQAQLLLRSGCYVTHDSSHYEQRSPLGAAAGASPEARLRPALEIWSSVLSRPEPGLALLGMGKRDMPTDLDLPTPLWRARDGAAPERLGAGYEVFRANDQHAYLRLPPDADVRVGDLLGCGISHPCTAFDKWRVLLVVDEQRTVIDAVRTYF